MKGGKSCEPRGNGAEELQPHRQPWGRRQVRRVPVPDPERYPSSPPSPRPPAATKDALTFPLRAGAVPRLLPPRPSSSCERAASPAPGSGVGCPAARPAPGPDPAPAAEAIPVPANGSARSVAGKPPAPPGRRRPVAKGTPLPSSGVSSAAACPPPPRRRAAARPAPFPQPPRAGAAVGTAAERRAVRGSRGWPCRQLPGPRGVCVEI